MRRGRKYEEQASMMMPRREKTKPILAVALATRMLVGRHIVMPTPTAAPFMAAMVGLEQLWMARETRPPLGTVSVSAVRIGVGS